MNFVVRPQESLLHVAQVRRVAVDDYEPHAALEGRSRALTVGAGAAWTEEGTRRQL